MKLSTTLNLFILQHDQGMTPYYDELANYKEIGFPILDCIFCNADGPYSPLRRDDWQEWGAQIAEQSQKLGITYEQCHMPYYNFAAPGKGIDSECEVLVRRSVVMAAMLGAKWIVGHPATAFDRYDMPAASKEANRRYFTPYLELGERLGIGIAIENMADFPGQGYKRSYCATIEELCDLVDTLDSSRAGVCWDFGHANLVYKDQNPCLRAVGNRLKALHVHDNRGNDDSHYPVFFGNIEWELLMHTLKEINYGGVFSFEIKRIPVRLPKNVRNAQWQYAKTTGEYLLAQTAAT